MEIQGLYQCISIQNWVQRVPASQHNNTFTLLFSNKYKAKSGERDPTPPSAGGSQSGTAFQLRKRHCPRPMAGCKSTSPDDLAL